MIYICINKGKIKSLTKNKAYEGHVITKRHFICIDDNGYQKSFSIRRFIKLQDYRDKKIKEVLRKEHE